MMCRLLEVSRGGFYGWMRRPESRRSREDRRLLVEIRGIHQATRGSYGSPRIVRELRGLGYSYGRNRVARVMRDHGIVGKHRRKFRHTTDSDHGHPVAENLLGTVEPPTVPDRVWVADITYLWTREGWLYVAGMMDLVTHRIVGWATSRRLERGFVIAATPDVTPSPAPTPISLKMYHSTEVWQNMQLPILQMCAIVHARDSRISKLERAPS